MRRAKSDGNGTYRLFEPEMDQRERERRQIERDLRLALERNELEVFYQPLVDLRSRRISGLEALVRWRHPTGGLILPGTFIPVAEDSGLIVPLGEFVLRRACLDAVAWPADVRVAVNMSAAQLRSASVVDMVKRALSQAGLPPSKLEIEVTESLLIDSRAAGLQILHAIRDMGVRIAIDDFGTGYASLSYLRDFPFDKIKIDRSFIQGLLERPECLAIVRAMVRLAGSLGVAVVAEGVESADQLTRLRAEGCTEVQSFLLWAPMPVDEVTRLLKKQDAMEVLVA
jgi:EAL domain-containing protein (putative c-di-GMP-specific phosphodiesterase class I)